VASTVFLHIGAPLTGSVRESLTRNRRRLTRAGVLYPPSHVGHDGGHLDAALDVLGLAAPEQSPAAGAWDRVAESVRDWRRGTAVLSSELFAEAAPAQVERIVDSLGKAEVHVVYVARDLARQVPVAWQQWVRNGGTAPFAVYADRVLERDGHRAAKVFWSSHDLEAVLARWSASVPADRIHVVTVPPGAAAAEQLWSRFANPLGIDVRRFPAVPTRQPALLPLAATEVVRLLNAEAGPVDAVRLECLLGHLERLPGARPRLPAASRAAVLAEAERAVAAVQDSGYRWVGTAEDLLPQESAFAVTDTEVSPADAEVVAVQTRLVAALAGLSGPQGRRGPAGMRRRALRLLVRRPRP
jgi:hypothetical protein